MKKIITSALFVLFAGVIFAQFSFSGCYISGAMIDPGSTAGCGNGASYCNLASLYVPAFTPTACGTSVVAGGVNNSKLTAYTLPAGCTATIEAEFRKRNYLGVGSTSTGCSNSGMDGSPDGFQIVQSGGTVAAQGSTIDVNVGTCGAYPVLGTYTTAVATISPGCSNADGYIMMVLTGGSFSIQGTSNRADEIITFTLNLSGTCGPGCGDVLPVELTTFYAVPEEDNISLHWHAASETDTKEYVLDKSADAVTWTKMGTVTTNRIYNKNVFYRILDDHPLKGENYYRLTSYDNDGSSRVHTIVSATYLNKSEHFHLTQNDDELMITSHPALAGKTIVLYDISGRPIKRVKISENSSVAISKREITRGFLLLGCEDLPQIGINKILVY